MSTLRRGWYLQVAVSQKRSIHETQTTPCSGAQRPPARQTGRQVPLYRNIPRMSRCRRNLQGGLAHPDRCMLSRKQESENVYDHQYCISFRMQVHMPQSQRWLDSVVIFHLMNSMIYTTLATPPLPTRLPEFLASLALLIPTARLMPRAMKQPRVVVLKAVP